MILNLLVGSTTQLKLDLPLILSTWCHALYVTRSLMQAFPICSYWLSGISGMEWWKWMKYWNDLWPQSSSQTPLKWGHNSKCRVLTPIQIPCITVKTAWLVFFNHRVITLVADKLRRQWLWEVYFGIGDLWHKTTSEKAGLDYPNNNPADLNCWTNICKGDTCYHQRREYLKNSMTVFDMQL